MGPRPMRLGGVSGVVAAAALLSACAPAAQSDRYTTMPACGPPPVSQIPAADPKGRASRQPVDSTHPHDFGIRFAAAAGGYDILRLRIDVLTRGEQVYPQVGDPGSRAFEDGSDPHVRRLDVTRPGTGREYVVHYDGKDDSGRPLPSGDYPVGLYLEYNEPTHCAAGGPGGAEQFRSTQLIATATVSGN